MTYPLITPEATVEQCTCTHRVHVARGLRKQFRELPPKNGTPCAAHGKATM